MHCRSAKAALVLVSVGRNYGRPEYDKWRALMLEAPQDAVSLVKRQISNDKQLMGVPALELAVLAELPKVRP